MRKTKETTPFPELLTEDEAAMLLTIGVSTLQKWRRLKKGPSFVIEMFPDNKLYGGKITTMRILGTSTQLFIALQRPGCKGDSEVSEGNLFRR